MPTTKPPHNIQLPDSPLFIPHAWNVPAAMWADEPQALEAFRTGRGVAWGEHDARMACGSAACSAAVSGARTGRTGRKVAVIVASSPNRGTLHIEWRERDDHVVMTGPAEWEWAGVLDPTTGAWQRQAENEAGAR